MATLPTYRKLPGSNGWVDDSRYPAGCKLSFKDTLGYVAVFLETGRRKKRLPFRITQKILNGDYRYEITVNSVKLVPTHNP